MKVAPIAFAAAALVSLQTLSEAATFQSVSGTGFVTETALLVNSYLTPKTPAGSSIASYSMLSTAAGFPNGHDQLRRPRHGFHLSLGISGLLQQSFYGRDGDCHGVVVQFRRG